MTPEELRQIIRHLEARVRLTGDDSRTVGFEMPTEAELLEAGLSPEGVKTLLASSWLPEMVSEILETPDFCEPEESPEQLLTYARDVVSEYIRKRFPL